MANQNDSERAEVVAGTHDGLLGARQRVREEAGEVTYGNLSPQQQQYVASRRWTLKGDGGAARDAASEYGLPNMIRGNPLGCKCRTATLVGATKPVMGHIEADYMCDSGYHNFVVFRLIGFDARAKSELKLDSNGNIVDTSSTETAELGEF